jgi:hypothetical protein
MTGTAIAIVIGIIMAGVVAGIFTNWLGDRPQGFPVHLAWVGLAVAVAVAIVLTLDQGGAFKHQGGATEPSSESGASLNSPPSLSGRSDGTASPTANFDASDSTNSRASNGVSTQSQPSLHSSKNPVDPTSAQSPQTQPHVVVTTGSPTAVDTAPTWSGPPLVTVSPSSFENLGSEVDLTVTVQSSADASIEAEIVGLPESPGNCPTLKPVPCDIPFSTGVEGATDSNGMLTFIIEWFPGDACNYSGTGDEFTYPKGTFDYSIDVKDDTTGLVSSDVISATNGPDTPTTAPSC